MDCKIRRELGPPAARRGEAQAAAQVREQELPPHGAPARGKHVARSRNPSQMFNERSRDFEWIFIDFLDFH